MKTSRNRSLCIGILVAALFSPTGVRAEVDEYNVPDGLTACVRMEKGIVLDDRMNPFYLSADFDGNKIIDFVSLVVETSTRKAGFLVCLGEGKDKWQPIRLGAGTSVALEGGFRFDELEGFDAWNIDYQPVRGAAGPGIHLVAKESGSGVFYWRSGRFQWQQLGI